RFSRLSVRSPIIENPTAVRHSGRNSASGTWNHRLPAMATSALSAIPPNTPSQVLPADTSGARRTRPKRRPKKKAPMSATPASTRSAITATVAKGGSQSRIASSTAASTTPVNPRVRSVSATTRSGLRRGVSRHGVAEAPLAAGEERECVLQIRHREIRPQPRTEIQLRVGEIPQQEVADSVFTAGADQQIRLRQSRERELGAKTALGDVFRP